MEQAQTRIQELEQVIVEAKTEISDISRDSKAYALLDSVNIIPEDNIAIVTSGKKVYRVDYHGKVCECPDHTYRHVDCKHIRAVIMKLEMENSI